MIRRTGRTIGVLLITHMVGSGMVNFVMERPLSEGGFLVNAGVSSRQIGVAVILGLVTEAVWLVIAITVFPIFFPRSPRTALCLVALAIVSLALAVVENIAVMSMVSLSEAYGRASAVEQEQLRAVGIAVTAGRDWPHFISRIFVAATTFVFYSVLYRFVAIPRVLAVFGLIASVLMVTSVALPLFGQKVIFPLLAPMGICHLLVAVWLLAKGFAFDSTAPVTAAITREA